jgi:hypothetical protein
MSKFFIPSEDEIQRKVNKIRNLLNYRSYSEEKLRETAYEMIIRDKNKKEKKDKKSNNKKEDNSSKSSEKNCFLIGHSPVFFNDEDERRFLEKEYYIISEHLGGDISGKESTIASCLMAQSAYMKSMGKNEIDPNIVRNIGDQVQKLRKELGIDRNTINEQFGETGLDVLNSILDEAEREIEKHKDCFQWMCPFCNHMVMMEVPHFMFSSWCGEESVSKSCSSCDRQEDCGKTVWNDFVFESIRDGVVSIFWAAELFKVSIFAILYIAQRHGFDLGSINTSIDKIEKVKEMLLREGEKWKIPASHPAFSGIESDYVKYIENNKK